ncbi:hypothetical protein ACCO45_003483 [Purpureocillium lilacinum]|uniref:Uncharacterized protein n=1 Tax=Purpureocillium lilacinum TaxID=33203 RepID=A0ACC4E005_PURLI
MSALSAPSWQLTLGLAESSGAFIGTCDRASGTCFIDITREHQDCRVDIAEDVANLFKLGLPRVFNVTCSTEPAKACPWDGHECIWTNRPVQRAHCRTQIRGNWEGFPFITRGNIGFLVEESGVSMAKLSWLAKNAGRT